MTCPNNATPLYGLFAEFVETEVLPLVEKVAGIRLTGDPAGRIPMGVTKRQCWMI